MRLYHGSQNAIVEPKYGLGQDHHDFGRGFYLTDLLKLGGFGIQYVLKSPKAYEHLQALPGLRRPVEFAPHHASYETRDSEARRKMHELIADPQFNRLARLFNDLIREV